MREETTGLGEGNGRGWLTAHATWEKLMEDRRVPTGSRRLWPSVLNWIRMMEMAGEKPEVDRLERRVQALEAEIRARSPGSSAGDTLPDADAGPASSCGGRAEAILTGPVRQGFQE